MHKKFKIWLVASITPVDDVAGPLIVYRHFKYFEANGHELKTITHEKAGFQQGEAWETVKLKHTFLIKLIRRIFFRKFLHWIGEVMISYLFYLKAKKQFKSDLPDVIITTWSNYLLPCAYWLAKKYKLPLVIFCHDDYENQIKSDPINNFLKRKTLKKIYQFAAARLCVAEGMNEEFFKRYGCRGTVLYPLGGEVNQGNLNPSIRKEKLNFGYFGSISNGYEPLLFFANSLTEINHELHISTTGFPKFGPYVDHTHIKNLGFFKYRTDLLNYIAANIDVCVIAQSFDPKEEIFLKTNFPSKLIDMMGFNLPILIISPSYSSSARIALENPDTFIHINELDSKVMKEKIIELLDPSIRDSYATKIRELYNREFSPLIIHNQLEDIITNITT
jgi:hypothetical protein